MKKEKIGKEVLIILLLTILTIGVSLHYSFNPLAAIYALCWGLTLVELNRAIVHTPKEQGGQ